MATRLLFAVLSVAVILAQTSVPTSAQKPVRETEFHIDGGPPPPASMDELWSQATVVVEGTVAAAHPADEELPGRSPATLIYTTYEIKIKEVFKSDPVISSSASTVFVHRKGGIRDRGDHLWKHTEKGLPLFVVGESYILFLEPLSSGRYSLAGATGEGAFLVRGQSIDARGKSDVAETLASNPILFRELLRRKGAGR